MGIRIDVPGKQVYQIETIVFDLNGTLAVDGRLRSNTRELLKNLAGKVDVHVLTADTHHSALHIQEALGDIINVHVLAGENTVESKRTFIKEAGSQQTAAVGNGANDMGMLEEAVLSIAVLEAEGCSAEILLKADIVVRNTDDAIGLFLNPRRIVATLRR